MAQTVTSPNGEYTLFLERNGQASHNARELITKFDPSVEVIYVEENDPESPVPNLRERFGATYYGLDAIRAYIANEEKIREFRKQQD